MRDADYRAYWWAILVATVAALIVFVVHQVAHAEPWDPSGEHVPFHAGAPSMSLTDPCPIVSTIGPAEIPIITPVDGQLPGQGPQAVDTAPIQVSVDLGAGAYTPSRAWRRADLMARAAYLGDTATTVLGFKLVGPSGELNPIYRLLLKVNPNPWAFVAARIAVGEWMIHRAHKSTTPKTEVNGALIIAGVDASNFVQILRFPGAVGQAMQSIQDMTNLFGGH